MRLITASCVFLGCIGFFNSNATASIVTETVTLTWNGIGTKDGEGYLNKKTGFRAESNGAGSKTVELEGTATFSYLRDTMNDNGGTYDLVSGSFTLFTKAAGMHPSKNYQAKLNPLGSGFGEITIVGKKFIVDIAPISTGAFTGIGDSLMDDSVWSYEGGSNNHVTSLNERRFQIEVEKNSDFTDDEKADIGNIAEVADFKKARMRVFWEGDKGSPGSMNLNTNASGVTSVIAKVPEPSSFLCFASLAGLAGFRRRRLR